MANADLDPYMAFLPAGITHNIGQPLLDSGPNSRICRFIRGLLARLATVAPERADAVAARRAGKTSQ